MQESYSGFAEVYDIFMDNVPYEEWVGNIISLLKEYGLPDSVAGVNSEVYRHMQEGHSAESTEAGCEKDAAAAFKQETSNQNEDPLAEERRLILDLGCGTGTLTEMMANLGCDMIGVDNSMEMLEIAREKQEESGSGILYLLQDMRELELFCTVGAAISICDSVNYLLEEEDLLETFRKVNNYLYPGGVFIFDFNTKYKYEEVMGDFTIAENREDCSFIWENYYHEEEQINEYELTIFARKPGQERFDRFTETHYQRGYTISQMKTLVEEAGMTFLAAIDVETMLPAGEESERVYIIARECGKE